MVTTAIVASALAEYDSYYDDSADDLRVQEHKLKVYQDKPKYHRVQRSTQYEDETVATDFSLAETKSNTWKKVRYLPDDYYYYYHPKKYYRGRRSTEDEPELDEYNDVGGDEHKLRRYYGRRYYNRYRGYYPKYYKGYYRYRPYYG